MATKNRRREQARSEQQWKRCGRNLMVGDARRARTIVYLKCRKADKYAGAYGSAPGIASACAARLPAGRAFRSQASRPSTNRVRSISTWPINTWPISTWADQHTADQHTGRSAHGPITVRAGSLLVGAVRPPASDVRLCSASGRLRLRWRSSLPEDRRSAVASANSGCATGRARCARLPPC